MSVRGRRAASVAGGVCLLLLAARVGAQESGAPAPVEVPIAETPEARAGSSDARAEQPPPLYRELPVPLAGASVSPPAAAPRRRGVRIGPWEIEGRLALHPGPRLGSGLALGYRVLPRLALVLGIGVAWDVADDGAAGPSGIASSWGWNGSLELKGYLDEPRVRRLVALLRLRASFSYGTLEEAGTGESTASYALGVAPFVGASVFFAPRVGVLAELGLEVVRLISSSRHAWQGGAASRIALVLRW